MQKQPINTPEAFQQAMMAIKAAFHTLEPFDWQEVVKVAMLVELGGPKTFPELHALMLKDPQWGVKTQLIGATSRFVEELAAVQRRLENEG